MLARSLSLLAVTAVVSVAAATQAAAGSCCGGCAYSCAPPPQVQIWGLTPSFVVNQGPVYTGPGFYTSPTYQGEASTVDYPYVGHGDYPRNSRPYYGVTYLDPYRDRLYWPYSQGTGFESLRRGHRELRARREW